MYTYESAGRKYLESNSKGFENGAIKAEMHRVLVELFISEKLELDVSAIKSIEYRIDDHIYQMYPEIRKATLSLTDYLDEVIGFPLDKAPNYKKLVPLFVDEFKRIANDWWDDRTYLFNDSELQSIMSRVSHKVLPYAYDGLDSYGFYFVDGVGDGDNPFLTMTSALGQTVTVTRGGFFGSKFTIDTSLADKNK